MYLGSHSFKYKCLNTKTLGKQLFVMAETVIFFLFSLIVTDSLLLEMLIKNNSKLSQLNKLSHCVGIIRELNLLQFSQAKKWTRKFETYF